MSELTKAIIRGFGGQIGRNLASGSRRSSYTPTTRSVGRPAKSSFDKSLEYPIGGRVSTMIGKQFNMIQEFESYVSTVTSVDYFLSFANATNKVKEKFNDTSKYIDMAGSNDETESQTQQMVDMLTVILKKHTQLMVDNITVDNITNSNLDNLIDLATQLNIPVDNDKINHLKQLAKSQSIKTKIKDTTTGILVWVFLFVCIAGCVALSIKN